MTPSPTVRVSDVDSVFPLSMAPSDAQHSSQQSDIDSFVDAVFNPLMSEHRASDPVSEGVQYDGGRASGWCQAEGRVHLV